MPPCKRRNDKARGWAATRGLHQDSGAGASRRMYAGSSRHMNAGSSRQPSRTPSTQPTTIIIDDTTSDNMSSKSESRTDSYSNENGMSINSGSTTDAYSSDDDSSSSDSEENIVHTKPHRILNLHPGQSIVRGIPGRFYSDEFSSDCVWGNKVTLYRQHIIHLHRLIKAKESSIPYYVCELNKTFASPTQRMYFNMNFSRTYLLTHISQTKNVLPIKKKMEACMYQLSLLRELTIELQSQQAGKPSSSKRSSQQEPSAPLPSSPQQRDSILRSMLSKHLPSYHQLFIPITTLVLCIKTAVFRMILRIYLLLPPEKACTTSPCFLYDLSSTCVTLIYVLLPLILDNF